MASLCIAHCVGFVFLFCLILFNKFILCYFISEPGYYEDGQFGIRIEDIVQVVPANITNNFSGRGALTFNTVTMCPIQTKLVDSKLLSESEKNSLNAYHLRVRETLGPLLLAENDQFTYEWLLKETNPIP